MSISCLIVDDKPLAIDVLADYASKVSFLKLIATTNNPIEGISIIREQQIDLVFLDIQMPELTGLQFMKIIGKQCKVILTTAYSEYALEGFEHDVIDYLLKPIAFDRFYRAADKALQIIGNKETAKIIGPGEHLTKKAADYLFFKTEHRIQKVILNEILFIEGLQNYISIITSTERVLSLQTLKKIEEELSSQGFIRVHKSYIVAFRHITYIERSRIFIGDQIIPVGENYREDFFNKIDSR